MTIPPVAAEEPGADPVVRVEEEWKLVLNEPDSGVNAPLFQTVMSPAGGECTKVQGNLRVANLNGYKTSVSVDSGPKVVFQGD